MKIYFKNIYLFTTLQHVIILFLHEHDNLSFHITSAVLFLKYSYFTLSNYNAFVSFVLIIILIIIFLRNVTLKDLNYGLD